MRGLLRLTWLEIKIFVREPLGLIGTVGIPVLIFVVLARVLGKAREAGASDLPRVFASDLPVLVAILIATNAVLSLVAILAIYREGGILKRLRATPMRAHTILTAHVLVKLLFTALTLALMILAGRRYYPVDADVPLGSFGLALVVSTVSIVSLGFLVASLVPTARFAQPVGSLIVYPMLAISGLFAPLDSLPSAVQRIASVLPFTYAVSLLRGVWQGDGWGAHLDDVAALAIITIVFTALSSRVFRWQ